MNQASQLAQPLAEERKLETRRDVLDALDTLQSAFESEETSDEQKIVRSILVANEAYLHNGMLEEPGELYLEVIALSRMELTPERSSEEREALIAGMRRTLRRPTGLRALFPSAQRWAALIFGSLGAFIITAGISAFRVSSSPIQFPSFFSIPRPYDFISSVPWAFLTLFTVSGFLWLFVWTTE